MPTNSGNAVKAKTTRSSRKHYVYTPAGNWFNNLIYHALNRVYVLTGSLALESQHASTLLIHHELYVIKCMQKSFFKTRMHTTFKYFRHVRIFNRHLSDEPVQPVNCWLSFGCGVVSSCTCSTRTFQNERCKLFIARRVSFLWQRQKSHHNQGTRPISLSFLDQTNDSGDTILFPLCRLCDAGSTAHM